MSPHPGQSRTGTIDQRTFTADVIASVAENGEVRLNIGYSSEDNKGVGAGSPAWWGSDGFVSRPNNPDDDGACMVWGVQDGSDKRVLGYRDNRFSDKVVNLQPGDRAVVSRGSARFILGAGDNSVSLYALGDATDQDCIITVNGDGDFAEMRVGSSMIRVTDDGVTIIAKGGKTIVTVDEDGFQVDGNSCRLNCQTGMLGSLTPTVPGVPPPVPANSILIGPTGPTGVPSSGWSCSP